MKALRIEGWNGSRPQPQLCLCQWFGIQQVKAGGEDGCVCNVG